jgi:hypothetical protein
MAKLLDQRASVVFLGQGMDITLAFCSPALIF